MGQSIRARVISPYMGIMHGHVTLSGHNPYSPDIETRGQSIRVKVKVRVTEIGLRVVGGLGTGWGWGLGQGHG